ncbi:bifunctional 4-hydroxy-2-oxoglutarate aldolase/2-dehydro-3-deoxy-phosphogluconate aldolase [Vibrio artabrorum]|uniref:bifunctional 4-hydroxy-2-oxoglutarate aldolase/2-dehydro-3-deoxy-phosphogluconate aldolase n=1 Tax=Vibrio artabrorum TaxID=446374 RepID=UPI00354C938F
MTWTISPQRVFSASPVVPVMVINDLDDAIPMGQALLDGGISVFEVTLRTECALDAIRILADTFPQAIVGAGTVLNTAQYDAAVTAGAQFIISPGFSITLLKYAQQKEVALIPGVATPSEMMTALEFGYTHLKFFPAEANGGAKALAAMSAPLPQVTICPTGGISVHNLEQYINLPTVATVGGSWMLPKSALDNKDWVAVAQLSKEVCILVAELKK